MAMKKKGKKEPKVLSIRATDQNPLRWPDGQERTLIDRQTARNAWKKSFAEYRQKILERLDIFGVSEVLFSYNLAPSDRQDPGVAMYFSKPRKEDYSWQAALGIDKPMPTKEEIEDAFKAKALKHHPDEVGRGSGGDIKLWYVLKEHKDRAIAWVTGNYTREGEYAIAVDRCKEPRWNLRAIWEILKAVAVMDEFGNPGTLERTFRGFKTALPAKASTSKES
jgi:hypothetical protein